MLEILQITDWYEIFHLYRVVTEYCNGILKSVESIVIGRRYCYVHWRVFHIAKCTLHLQQGNDWQYHLSVIWIIKQIVYIVAHSLFEISRHFSFNLSLFLRSSPKTFNFLKNRVILLLDEKSWLYGFIKI